MNALFRFTRRRSHTPPREEAELPKLDRLQLSDDEDAPVTTNGEVSSSSAVTGNTIQDRPSRVLRVSGLDGVGVDMEIHSRDSVGVIKSRISAAMGVHKDLQDVFDADSAEPFDDDMELPDEVTDLTVINKTPDLHKVTPGPPLNCRRRAVREANVVASFQPGDIVKVIGGKTKGGTYGEGHTDWVPILVEVKQEVKKEVESTEADNETVHEPHADGEKSGQQTEMVLTKAWCACGSETDAYLTALTEEELKEYLRG